MPADVPLVKAHPLAAPNVEQATRRGMVHAITPYSWSARDTATAVESPISADVITVR